MASCMRDRIRRYLPSRFKAQEEKEKEEDKKEAGGPAAVAAGTLEAALGEKPDNGKCEDCQLKHYLKRGTALSL